MLVVNPRDGQMTFEMGGKSGEQKKLSHLDLCSGIGWFAVAAQWAGFETVGFSEIDKFCNERLSELFPGIPNFGDIKNVSAGAIGSPIDLVTAGFPCTPFSVAGKRKGAKDDRYLWPSVHRVIKSVRPAWCLIENSYGITTMEFEECLPDLENCPPEIYEEVREFANVVDSICSDLERIGYSVQPFVVPACSCDSPHLRLRLWLVAHRNSDGIHEKPVGEVLSGQGSKSDGDRKTPSNPDRGLGIEPKKKVCPGRYAIDGRSEVFSYSDSQQGGILHKAGKDGPKAGRSRRSPSDSNCKGLEKRNVLPGIRRKKKPGSAGEAPVMDGKDAPHPHGGHRAEIPRPDERSIQRRDEETRSDRGPESGLGGVDDVGILGGMDFYIWPDEPDRVPPVAAGIKDRNKRLKAIGNAIVPQVAYEFIRVIAGIEREGLKIG